jgi:hypothetical protein
VTPARERPRWLALAGRSLTGHPVAAGRSTVRHMPDRQEAAGQASKSDPIMGTIVTVVLVLAVFLAAVTALAYGLTWKGLLHWTGELLLITGILLAAIGISDVRREWTGLPGIRGRAAQRMRAIQALFVSWAWEQWNRFAERTWFGQWLGLRPRTGEVTASGDIPLKKMRVSATAETAWNVPPGNAALEERVAWLENRVQAVGVQIATLNASHEQEVRDRQAATEEERKARMAEDQRIRERMADLAGGGLRLQTWGVVCLLAGTIMIAIW